MEGVLAQIMWVVGVLFFLAFFIVRGMFGLAMRGTYDSLSIQLAWIICSPLLLISLYCFWIAFNFW